MPRIKIKATNDGFYNESPLGQALPPNVFLKSAKNISGQINSTSTGWEAGESWMYEAFGTDVFVNIDPSAIDTLGSQTQIEVTEFSYFRIENDLKIETASIELPQPLVLTATYDQISQGNYGWMAQAGEALEDFLQTEGLVFIGGNGDDIFAPHSTILPAYADNIIRGRGGNDKLTGGLGDDIIKGGSGADLLFDPDGNNVLHGQSGDDILHLGDGSNGSLAKGGHGDDQLFSGNGNDTLRGGAGNDFLKGGRGNDRLFGGQGDDVLAGGNGSDFLKGHAGADQFVFNTEDQGHDRIADFSDGHDMIMLIGLEGFTDLTIGQSGNDTFVSWAGDSDLTLSNFNDTHLGAEDFIFV